MNKWFYRFALTVFCLSLVLHAREWLVAAEGEEGAPADKAKVEVSAKDCQRLTVNHQAAPDVAYKPGVDVHGKKVKSADLHDYSGVLAAVPTSVEFDLSISPMSGVDALADSTASVGTIKYDIMSGQMTYNGVRLDDQQQTELAAACRNIPK